MSKKPEICPVSYPKMIPPTETKAPRKKDLRVRNGTGLSSRGPAVFSWSVMEGDDSDT